jgi:hypothetical protein
MRRRQRVAPRRASCRRCSSTLGGARHSSSARTQLSASWRNCGRRRSPSRTTCRASTSSTRAAPSCPGTTRSFPTAITSVASAAGERPRARGQGRRAGRRDPHLRIAAAVKPAEHLTPGLAPRFRRVAARLASPEFDTGSRML